MLRFVMAFALGSGVVNGAGDAHAAETRTIALHGGVVPANTEDIRFDRFEVPVIDAVGNVAFVSDLEGADLNGSESAIFVAGESGPRAIVRQRDAIGSAAPGAGFAGFSALNLSPSGHIAFIGAMDGASAGADSGIFRIAPEGDVELVARAGDRIPGSSHDDRYGAFFTGPAINSEGAIAFFPAIDAATGQLSSGLVGTPAGLGSVVSLISQAGDPAPGTEPNTVFLAQGFENPFSSRTVIDGRGRSLVHGFVEGPDSPFVDDSGLWRSTDQGGLELLARVGDSVPGLPETTFLSFAQLPRLNENGDVTFAAFVTGPNTQLFDVCISRALDERLETVACTGQEVIGADIRFGDLSLPNINHRGEVSFQAVLVGSGIDPLNEKGIWVQPVDSDAAPRLAVRAGEEAPGTEADVVFRAFATHVLNGEGQLAFVGAVGGPSVSTANGNVLGIWAEDTAGELHLVARDGDQMEVSPGDIRTIASLGFQSNTGNSDGQPTGFNDAGLLTFRATFTDGTSGIFVSQISAVPEPGAPCAGLMSLLLLVVLRRKLLT